MREKLRDRGIYSTVVNDIPVLKTQADEYLAETPWDEWEKE